MSICEVCGREGEWDYSEKDEVRMETGMLHICESCQQDRNFHPFEQNH